MHDFPEWIRNLMRGAANSWGNKYMTCMHLGFIMPDWVQERSIFLDSSLCQEQKGFLSWFGSYDIINVVFYTVVKISGGSVVYCWQLLSLNTRDPGFGPSSVLTSLDKAFYHHLPLSTQVYGMGNWYTWQLGSPENEHIIIPLVLSRFNNTMCYRFKLTT